MRVVPLVLALGLLACGAEHEAAPEPPTEQPRTEPEPEPEEPEPEPLLNYLGVDTRCESGADCVLAFGPHGTSIAVRRGQEEVARERLEARSRGDGRRSEWAPPEEQQAYCREGQCWADRIVFPDHRRCEPDDACVRIDDPCGAPVPVRADGAREARREIQSATRRRLCRHFEDEEGADGPEPSCVRGFCQ